MGWIFRSVTPRHWSHCNRTIFRVWDASGVGLRSKMLAILSSGWVECRQTRSSKCVKNSTNAGERDAEEKRREEKTVL